jgi:hypothetical protein
MKQLFYIIFLMPVLVMAQKPCATIMNREQMDKLHAFQLTLDKSPRLFLNKAIKYVPIKVHIVGNDKGNGYYKTDLLIASFCKINRDFSPIGVQFYIKGDIDYINNSLLYQTDDNTIYDLSTQYKDNDAVNVFFAGSSNTYCGVYYGGLDVVYVINSCQGINATTLTHELGHFFSLPHTFRGWENNTTPNVLNQEKVDGSNCRNAGDGFCDTRPDYIASRWDCSNPHFLKDPNGVVFRADSSIFMNYSLDVCHSRFSQEQFAAMDNNLAGRGIISQNMIVENPAVPSLTYPLNNDSSLNSASVRLTWNKSEGATMYQVQIARLKLWETSYLNVLVKDTFYDAKLFGNWQFDWRVKALSLTNMCGNYSESQSFFAKAFPAGTEEVIADKNNIRIFPNPSKNGQSIQIQSSTTSQLSVFDMSGKEVFSTDVLKGITKEFTSNHSGLYMLRFTYEGGEVMKKILVE